MHNTGASLPWGDHGEAAAWHRIRVGCANVEQYHLFSQSGSPAITEASHNEGHTPFARRFAATQALDVANRSYYSDIFRR